MHSPAQTASMKQFDETMKQTMKYTFAKGLLVAALATTFAACSTDDTTDQQPTAGKIKVSLQATMPETRSQITVDEENGRFSGAWDASDAMTDYANTGKAGVRCNADTKVFEGELTDQTTDWTYQAIYPRVETEGAEHRIPFGAARTQNGSNFNGAYDPLVSEPVTHANSQPGKTPEGDAVTFGLQRLTSIIALTFTTDDAAVSTEKVQSVTLTAAGGEILAAQTFDISRDDQTGALSTEGQISTEGQSSSITMSYNAGSEPAAAEFKAYFNVPAGTYGALTATIVTEGHTATVVLTDDTTLTAGELAYKTTAVSAWNALAAAPTFEWVGHTPNADGTYDKEEVKKDMSVKVNLQAAAGIKGFVITIDSPTLAGILGSAYPTEGSVVTLDMINDPNTAGISSMIQGFPETLPNYSEPINLDLSTLVPMILMLPGNTGDHLFTLAITDNQDRTIEKTLPFYVPEPSATFGNVDLWNNTATITLDNIPANAQSISFSYRKTGTETWNEVTVENKSTATIAPKTTQYQTASWKTLNTVLPYSRIDSTTGIFAGNKYDYKLTVDGQDYVVTEAYTASNAPAAQTIPDGDMENNQILCFADNTVDSRESDFWNSGNNSMSDALCSQSSFLGSNRAKCQSKNVAGLAFACGNLFSGNFNYASYKGTVEFGQKLPLSARPSALKVAYHATIGNVDSAMGTETKIGKGNPDYARIFVCIVDWNARHKVVSSPNVLGGILNKASLEGSWDPETQTSTDEGQIIAYGSYWINHSMNSAADQMDEVTIDLNYYDTAAKPSSDNYSVVISCACSAYGDYFNGCSSNTLYVDDFEWVY